MKPFWEKNEFLDIWNLRCFSLDIKLDRISEIDYAITLNMFYADEILIGVVEAETKDEAIEKSNNRIREWFYTKLLELEDL